jgi:hypothetical protein
MSIYDLRPLFPLGEREFTTNAQTWICRLAEVSDKRPEEDRLFWYLVFEKERGPSEQDDNRFRKLEFVTEANRLVQEGFPAAELEGRLQNWLDEGEEDGRREWLDL